MQKIKLTEAIMGDMKHEDMVSVWHEAETGMELHDFLGMTWEEYRAWV